MKRWLLALTVVLAVLVGRQVFHQVEFLSHRAFLDDQIMQGGDRVINGRVYDIHELGIARMASFPDPRIPRVDWVDEHFDHPVETIADFSDRLAAEGIELWVIPVPTRPVINAANLRGWGSWGPAPRTYTPQWDWLVDALEARNVTVIDVLPRLQAGALEAEDDWVPKADHHWSNSAIIAAAELIAELLRERGFADALAPVQTTVHWDTKTRDLDRGLEGTEIVPFRTVRHADGSRIPFGGNSSPVLLFGDSHIGWFKENDADIGRQLTHLMRARVDMLELQGGGATRSREELVRREWNEPGYLTNRRVVVWALLGTSLYTHEWRVTPLEAHAPSRLALRKRVKRLAADRVLLDDGVGIAGISAAFKDPRDARHNDGIAWIRKARAARLTFAAQGDRDLLIEFSVKRAPTTVDVIVNGKRRARIAFKRKGNVRRRVHIHEGDAADTMDRVDLKVRTPKGGYLANAVGIRDLVQAPGVAIRALGLGELGAIDGIHPTSGGPEIQGSVVVPVPDGATAVRMRLHAVPDRQPVPLTVHVGDLQLANIPLQPAWREHAVELPIGAQEVILSGEARIQLLEWEGDRESDP